VRAKGGGVQLNPSGRRGSASEDCLLSGGICSAKRGNCKDGMRRSYNINKKRRQPNKSNSVRAPRARKHGLDSSGGGDTG